MLQLGYRDVINHYVGMSHYFALGADGKVAEGLCDPCAAWHADFVARAKALGYEIILSLSYELLDAHCPAAWKQRAADGSPALTGWMPPSALLSPANADAMAWLQGIARDFVRIASAAAAAVRFQVGEPWWWVRADGTICLYDAAATAAFAPVPIADVRGVLDAGQRATLDAAGAALASSTAALCAAVRAEAPGAECLLLAYLPTVLDGAEARRANLPAGWAAPAFDVLQLEDYDWVTTGNRGASSRGIAAATARLNYPITAQHYFAGFVLRPEDKAQWSEIAAAAEAAFARGTKDVFAWALPQVLRDGFTWFELDEEEDVAPFADELFPIAIGREATSETRFSTAVATMAGGAEQRNSDWADARLSFDVAPGVRSEAELITLAAFFRARRGAAQAFRFRDMFDDSSGAAGSPPGPGDQLLGIGDDVRTDFALLKHYGEQERRITRPVAGSVRVEVDDVERLGGWVVADGGVVRFDVAPAIGAQVRAGFRFDVPVRFADDRLELSRATFAAGEAVNVTLIEVRE